MTANRAETDDPFDLQRFLDVQEGVYARALSELVVGHPAPKSARAPVTRVPL